MDNPLQSYLAETLANIDGALACLVTDLSTGEILGVAHKIPYFSETLLEAVVAAAISMFRGKNTVAIENLLSSQSGETIEKSLLEIQATTKHTFHFMAVLPGKPDLLMVAVTSRNINLGMGWASVRNCLNEVAGLCR
jgi:hypothetical protein